MGVLLLETHPLIVLTPIETLNNQLETQNSLVRNFCGEWRLGVFTLEDWTLVVLYSLGCSRFEKEKNPNTLVTRTLVYVALHTNDDGTCPTEEQRDEVESIKEIAANDPSSTLLDLDHDPVARVYGPDSKGRVRGMGSGVTKRGLDASAPAKYQLKKQKEKESALVGEVENLKVLYQKMQEDVNIMKSAQGSNAQFSPDSSHLNHHGPAPDGFPSELSSVSCKLYSMRRVHVASGRAILGEEGNQEIIQTYDVVLDLVLVPTAQSTHMETLGEEEIGGIIEWPKAFTVFNC